MNLRLTVRHSRGTKCIRSFIDTCWGRHVHVAPPAGGERDMGTWELSERGAFPWGGRRWWNRVGRADVAAIVDKAWRSCGPDPPPFRFWMLDEERGGHNNNNGLVFFPPSSQLRSRWGMGLDPPSLGLDISGSTLEVNGARRQGRQLYCHVATCPSHVAPHT